MGVIDSITTTRADVPEVSYQKFILDNGLELILHVDRKLPVVHVNQWFHVGSKNERPGRTGFAHLFEHMMFQGSSNADDDYFQYVERAGANLREGGVNGTTDFDRTNYFATVPSGNLEFLLWLESDRLATLPDALTQEKLDNQREVVRNERRQSYENQPYGRAFLLINQNLHPIGHPYSWDVIGSHEDLIAASVDDVKEFFRTFYTPNNLSLTIAGDFDPEEARSLVERYYGSIAPGPMIERPRTWIPRLDSQKVVEVPDAVPQDRTYLSWPVPEYFSADEASLDIAARILSDGLSTRLSRALVYDRALCTDVVAFNETRELSGIFGVVATARPGVELGEIEEVIDRELARIADDGVTAEELNRARTKWEHDFISGLERIGGFGGKADRLNQYNIYVGDPGSFDRDLARYRSLTSQELQRSVRTWLAPSKRLAVRFLAESHRSAGITPVDRATTPALGIDRPFVAPHVEHDKLLNGMELFVVNRTDLPKVAATLVTRAGAVGDPAGKEGVAHLTSINIDMGTERLSSLDIEDAFGDLGTGLSGAAAREYSVLSLDILKRNLEAGFELFASVVREPSFPPAEFERERNRHLDALAQQSNNPASLAGRIRSMLAFGADHPYGRPAQGLPSTVASIVRDDLHAFHRARWRPQSSALIFAGDITPDEAKPLAERYFGSWRVDGSGDVSIAAPRPANPSVAYLIDKPGAAQTIIAQILPAPSRNADDYYAFRLVDAIWGGGGFGTRLNLNLREDKGYSYGVFSTVANFRHAGVWWSQGSVQTDKTKESLVEFMRELRDLAGEREISESELELARSTRVRGYSQQFESLGRIAGQVGELWSLSLPQSEMQREFDETEGATLESVRAAARNYVDPTRAILLLVGDLRAIEAGVREVLPEVVVLDAEGTRVR
jgi:zinc protease